MNKVLFSKKADDWATPLDFYNEVCYGMNAFDPCPLDPRIDGLSISWGMLAYVNPPYSDIKRWVKKALYQHQRYATDVIMLLPARTDTEWFSLLFHSHCCFFVFIKGRLKFGESKNSAAFPSVVVVVVGCKEGLINKFTLLDHLPLGEEFNSFFGVDYYV